MKSNHVKRIETERIKRIVRLEAQKQSVDIATRVENRWKQAMLNCGISVKTINRCSDEYERVVLENSKLKEEKLADYEIYRNLEENKIKACMPENEL